MQRGSLAKLTCFGDVQVLGVLGYRHCIGALSDLTLKALEMLRWLKVVAVTVFGVPLLAMLVWYSVGFLPHLGELRDFSARGSQSIKDVERVLYPMALASESREQIRSYAMRQAFYSLVWEKTRSGMFGWHANNAMWYGASYLHFSERELFGIWAHCALTGCGHGISEVARAYFAKELSSLSEREIAGLLGIVRSLNRFAPGSAATEKRIDEVLAKVKATK